MTPLERADALDVVTFGAGGHRFGVEAALVAARVAEGAGAVAAEAALGLPEAAGAADGRALLRLGEHLLAVTPPVELLRLAASSIHPLPPLVAGRTRLPALRALAFDRAGVILLVDAGRLSYPAPPSGAGDA